MTNILTLRTKHMALKNGLPFTKKNIKDVSLPVERIFISKHP